MKDVFSESTFGDATEMMPAFCFYYEEILYCQSFQVRLEVNYRISFLSLLL